MSMDAPLSQVVSDREICAYGAMGRYAAPPRALGLLGMALHEDPAAAVRQRAAVSASMPVFQVDPAWLKLPNK
jgi:hypothetical protein